MTEGVPAALGRYRILRHLRSGGMAELYLAVATGPAGFEREVVLKCVHQKHAANPNFVRMLIDEARIVARLRHGNIVPLFDFGEMDGRYFLAMEHVDGVDLARVLRRAELTGRPFPRAFALYVAAEVANGLEHAHSALDGQGRPLGIVHRDVSPSNIIVTYEGEVRILDFGIAKAEQRLTETTLDVVKGKVHYMSPEQATMDSIDGRSDLYALGVVMFQMIAGKLPFEGSHSGALLERICREDVPSLAEHVRGIEPSVVGAVSRALARRREDRWQRAGDLADALSSLLHAQDPGFSPRRLAAYVRAEFPQREGVAARVAAQFAMLPEPSLQGIDAPKATATAEVEAVSDIEISVQVPIDGGPRAAPVAPIASSGPRRPSGPQAPARRSGPIGLSPAPARPPPPLSETPSAEELSQVAVWTRQVRRRRVMAAVGAAVGAAMGVALMLGAAIELWDTDSSEGSERDEDEIAATKAADDRIGTGRAPRDTADGVGAGGSVADTKAPATSVTHVLAGTSVMAAPPATAETGRPAATGRTGTAVGAKPPRPTIAKSALAATAAPVSAVAAVPRPAGVPPPRGYLLVRVHPWAQVYVDGTFVGTAPMPKRELSPGSHSVRLVNTALGKDETRPVVIVAGETVQILLTWKD